MPRGDGTGPAGQGPMTGRGMGYCAVGIMSGLANLFADGFGRGMARGRGGMGFGLGLRRGRGCGFYPAAPVDESAGLKSQVTMLEEQLAAVRERLNLIENEDKA